MALRHQLLAMFQTYLNKKEPFRPGVIISENFRDPLESCLEYVFHQPYVTRSYVYDCCYIIELEFQGIRTLPSARSTDVIRGTSLALRRFYQKFGTYVHANEIFVNVGEHDAIIYVALNTYGLHQVMQRSRVQAKAMKKN